MSASSSGSTPTDQNDITGNAGCDESGKPVQGPLQGLRILDLSRLLPGPLATMLMADMGAEVIKIENPQNPDYIRHYPPTVGGQSAYYLTLNRSKRSLGLAIGSDRGRRLFFELLKTADIVLESFRPGVLEKLGIAYEQARRHKEDIIYVSITGYGQSGPDATLAGHDLNYMAKSGLLGLTGSKDGAPAVPGFQIADVAGGAYSAVSACLSALWARDRQGKGQKVDVSMTDAILPFACLQAAAMWAGDPNFGRGNSPLSGALANYNIYETSDGQHMALAALEPKFWNRFCYAIDKPEWSARILPSPQIQEELKADLKALFKTKSRQTWEKLGREADCCLSPVLDLTELESDQHLQSRQMFHHGVLDGGAEMKGFTPPLHFEQTPSKVSWEAPDLGRDNASLMRELGYSDADIEQLRSDLVISAD